MKRELLLATVILVVQLSVSIFGATCPNVATYDTTLNPICDVDDLFIKLPNYENPDLYYECIGPSKPVVVTCPVGTVFTYVQQKCTSCSDYVPPPSCESLKSQPKENCKSLASTILPETTRTTSAMDSTSSGGITTKTTSAPATNTTSGGGIATKTTSTPTTDTTSGGGIATETTSGPATDTTSGGGIGIKTTSAPATDTTSGGGIGIKTTSAPTTTITMITPPIETFNVNRNHV